MSGGSYDYLFVKELDELINNSNLERMRDRLIELGISDAATDTERIMQAIEAFREVEPIRNRLESVWKAVEWVDSLAWSEEEIDKAVDKYRQKR